jgi:PAS domain S-box-containing protein
MTHDRDAPRTLAGLDSRATYELRSGHKRRPTRTETGSLYKQARKEAQVELGKRRNAESDLLGHMIVEAGLMHDLTHQAHLLASASDAIIELRDADDTVQYWNHGAETLYGWSIAEAMGKDIHPLLKTVFPAPLNEIKAMLAKQGDWSGEVIHTKRDGAQVLVASHWTLECGGEAKPTSWLEINRDITERKKSELELVRAHNELEESNKSLRELSATLLRAQDEERRRIARELHDGTGQTLVALILALTALKKKVQILDPKLAKHVFETAELARQLATELRTTSYLLHPPLLDEIGLASALRCYIEGFQQRCDIEVTFELPAEGVRLPRDLELAIFRVVQECLTNIHRHSGSPTAVIRLQCGDELHLEVSDQGVGISPRELEKIASARTAGVGLRGIRERLRAFKAKMSVLSNGKGTSVHVSIPLTSTEGESA